MNNQQRTGLIACILAGSTSTAVFGQMMGKPPVPMTAAQFSGVRIGGSVQISVRVERVKRTTLYSELLEQKTDSLDKATGKRVTLYFADGTPVVMGTASEVGPGAVLFVYGVVTKPGHVDIKRAVVDTKYVKIEQR